MADTLSSNPYEPIFTAQKALFRSGATRAREWRLDQLARMERMVSENEAELQDAVKSDFKTASQEYVFETQTAIGEVAFQRRQLDDWMKPVEAPVPNPVAATGHRAVIYRDPTASPSSSVRSTARRRCCFGPPSPRLPLATPASWR